MSRTLVGVVVLFLSLTLTGCEDNAGVGGAGSLSIFLTDDPGFLEAWVNIRQIELVGGGEGDEEGGGIVVLRDEPFEQNLLTLANDVVVLVDEASVPAGTYSQLRFLIPDACIVIGEVVEGEAVPTNVYASSGYGRCAKDGITTETLHLPSFDQTGIKVNLPHEVLEVSPEGRALLVDFDVSESFGHQAGNSGMWVMTPVINAEDMSLSRNILVELTLGPEMVLPDIKENGNTVIAGPTLGDYFQAGLDTDAEWVQFTDPEDDGTFTASFLYLLPDQNYKVRVELKDGLSLEGVLSPTSPQTVSLTSAQDGTVAFQVNPSGT